MFNSIEQPYGSGRLRGTSWYNVLYDGILYQQNVDDCSNGTAYHIDQEWAHAQQQYDTCQHLVRSRERIDSQSGESLGSACDVSSASICRLMFNGLSLTGRPEHGQNLQYSAEPLECSTAARWNGVRSAQMFTFKYKCSPLVGIRPVQSASVRHILLESGTHSVRKYAEIPKFEEVP